MSYMSQTSNYKNKISNEWNFQIKIQAWDYLVLKEGKLIYLYHLILMHKYISGFFDACYLPEKHWSPQIR